MSEDNSSKSRAYVLSEDQRQEICRRYTAGESNKNLAKAFGVTDGSVSYIVKTRGAQVRVRSHYKLNDQQKEEICQRYKAGETLEQLSLAYGVNFVTVHGLLVRRKIPRRKGGPVAWLPKKKEVPHCKRCGAGPLPDFRWQYCRECRKEVKRLKMRTRRVAISSDGICTQCKGQLDRKAFTCSACNKKNLERIAAHRMACFDHYGGKCVCCGETTPEFLTLDHINDDGGRRRRAGEPVGQNLYIRMSGTGKFLEDLQILCWNCNWGKRLGKGVCPHQRKNGNGHEPFPFV